MAKYSKSFKENALYYLDKINKGETIEISGISEPISTVRDLCLALGGISSQTLYKWRKQSQLKKSFVEKHGKKIEDIEEKIECSELEMAKLEYEGEKIAPAKSEMKKELRLLINLVFTHRKEEYMKFGFKTVSEIRTEIDTLIDQL